MNFKENYIASVVIPVFNGLSTLPLQIEALEKQKTLAPFEIIVADNGSTDGLKEWIKEKQIQLLNLKYVDASATKGAAYARNKAASQASGLFLLFCDADDLVDAHWVENAVQALGKYPVVTGVAKTIFESEFSSIATVEEGWIKFDALDTTEIYSEAPHGAIAPVILGGNFAIHKSLFDSIGGFDTYFKSGSEDNDFSYRVKCAGVQLIEARNMRILYRIRENLPKLILRGYQTGITFSKLTYKHNAWDWVGPYKSLTIISIPKSFAKFILRYKRNDIEGNIARLSTALTVVGLLVGKYKYKYLNTPITFMEGFGYEKK
ncbi:glycosyltransferase family 2 protein [Rothia nasimurium]|uniref:glycosyltransferase family 2 protein n=1 Tax=Rothia nasimurium TaxID=85336 RepID=UPI0016234EA9|nr:glycosyltransferase [Rothia nasimurium]